jgi:anthranilate phosphoribosyltransferase
MTNPAGARRAVIGVFQPELLPLVSRTLAEIGSVDHAVVIHGCGLDEISPLGPSRIVEIVRLRPPGENEVTRGSAGGDDGAVIKGGYATKEYEFDPLSVGIPRCTLEDLKGGDPDENARRFVEVLEAGSHTDARRDAVVLNAGFGCYVYGLAPTVPEGVRMARAALESGGAARKLAEWIEASQRASSRKAEDGSPAE